MNDDTIDKNTEKTLKSSLLEDASGEPIDPKDTQIAKELDDSKFQDICTQDFGFQRLYHGKDGQIYIILF